MPHDLISPASTTQSLKSGLYIVSTPIGHLRDISLRGLDILAAVDEVLAEDTRRTKILLSTYGIETRLSAYHDHNAQKRISGLVRRLADGARLALVSDAGTPLVSDPGYKLVRAAITAGVLVVPIPGASALLAGLVSSGLPCTRFSFGGFLPTRKAARQTFLSSFDTCSGTLVFFETGRRLLDSLADMEVIFGDIEAALARELTKVHEEVWRGHLSELRKRVQTRPPKGELVLMLYTQPDMVWSEQDVDEALQTVLDKMGMKAASAHVAMQTGWSKRAVYQRALKLI